MRGRVLLSWIGTTVIGAPLVGWIAETLEATGGLIPGSIDMSEHMAYPLRALGIIEVSSITVA